MPVSTMDLRAEGGLNSSEEDPADVEHADLAEAFGTPPTRLNSIKPLRKLSSKSHDVNKVVVPLRREGQTILTKLQAGDLRGSRTENVYRQRKTRQACISYISIKQQLILSVS